MAERPRDMSKLPDLRWGEGSWGYDPKRRKLTLRHRWGGKPYTERGETPEECIVKRTRRRRDVDLRAGLVGDGTMAGLLAAWLEFQSEGRKDGTITGYEWTVGHMLAQLGADTLVTDLTVADIEVMYATLIRQGLGPTSVGKIRCNLGMALDFGVRRSLLPAITREQLARAVTPPVLTTKAMRGRRRWFDLDQFEIVRAYLGSEDGNARDALFLTMLLCGLRPSEALGLRWEYVDLQRRLLRVEGHIERHYRNGPERYTPILKTDHRHDHAHRAVPIPHDLAVTLGRMARVDDFVFIEDDGRAKGRRMRSDALHRHSLVVASSARVRHINPNGYRHTFASVCRHHGMPYETLAKLMGHKDATMIIQTYGHPIKDATPLDLDRYLGGDAAA